MAYDTSIATITVNGEEVSPITMTAEIPRTFNREVMVIESQYDISVKQVIINGIVYTKDEEV